MVKMLDVGAFLCKSCGEITRVKQDDVYVKAPVICKTCRTLGPWKMICEDNSFVDMPEEEWRDLQEKRKQRLTPVHSEPVETKKT